jgi:branched-chain amino acid aminotransferase
MLNSIYFNDKTVVYYNGHFVKAKEAGCSPYLQTLHYGLGVFDGMRAYQTPQGVKIFKAQDHFQRLRRSAEKIMLACPYQATELEQIAYSLLEMNKLKNAYIRPILLSADNMGLTASQESILFMGVWKWPRYLGEKLLHTCISSYQRPHPAAFPVDGKICGMYVNSIMATTEAKRKGFDEAIMLDYQGFVAQGPGANIFFEKDGVLFTPPAGNILQGITRRTIIDMARQMDIPVQEKHFSPQELMQADAAIFTGTAAEIAGIATINGIKLRREFNQTLCAQLSEHFMDLVHLAAEPAYTII